MRSPHALVFTFAPGAALGQPGAAPGLPAMAPRLPTVAPGLPDVAGLREAVRTLRPPGGVDPAQVFAPHPEHPRLEVFGDGAPPFALVEYRAREPAALRALAAEPSLRRALARIGDPADWCAGLFDVIEEPVPAPAAADARLSLLVHYHAPVEDAPGFARHYVAHHPPLLARLPRIRAILCHLPSGGPLAGWRADPTVIRNEVRFDSMDELLDALHSPARLALSADAQGFPRFGRSTHYPMERLRVPGGA